MLNDIKKQLATLAQNDLLRHRVTLDSPCQTNIIADGKPKLSFASNDYLGLANDPRLIQATQESIEKWGVGAGSSHLVGGHMTPHEALDVKLAAFVGAERALTFSNGYMANLGVVPTLTGRGDAIFADRLNHASLIDAAQLSRAEHHRYPHNDLRALEALLQKSTAKRKLILTDAVFSMDGDFAPLPALQALAEEYKAWLVVDDAHGFGVLGKNGRGSLSHFDMPFAPNIIYMGTLGKAAGVSGAFVAAHADVIEWLTQRARTYIFTTASSPIMASALLESIKIIEKSDDKRAHLQTLIAQLKTDLDASPWQCLDSSSAIQPIIIGENKKALEVARALADRDIWVPAIRPPTVPKGTARLRISLSANHTLAQLKQLTTALKEIA